MGSSRASAVRSAPPSESMRDVMAASVSARDVAAPADFGSLGGACVRLA
jgi:hypothetical protein